MHLLLRALLILSFVVPFKCFAAYETQLQQARQWLVTQQNANGSWGSLPTEKYISTLEVIKAFRAANIKNDAYYRGITWLQNHAPNNIDYSARRAVAFKRYGAYVGESFMAGLAAAQNTNVPGRSGWGISQHYIESPIDTALALEGLDLVGVGHGGYTVDTAAAYNYAKNAHQSGAGWSLSAQSSSDPFSTAIVLKSLVSSKQYAGLPASSQEAVEGMSYLQSNVNSGASPAMQAMAALAALSVQNAAVANTWLANLSTTQVNGSWSNGRVYDTALVMQAFANADGLNTISNQLYVNFNDANLRKAVNQALGQGPLEQIERGDLLKLTSLTATNLLISDLTGLNEATNLVFVDLRNNNITNTAAIDVLPNLTTALLDGNPVTGGNNPDPNPNPGNQNTPSMVPIWMQILFD